MSPMFSVLDVEKTYQVGLGPRPARFKPRPPRLLTALNGVRLEVNQGDAIALVGESGSGKSTLVRLMLGLEAASDGRILYRNTDLASLDQAAQQSFRRDIAFIYQDARGSMNPRMKIRDVLAEPLLLHNLCRESEVDDRVLALLAKVGLSADMAWRYPAELSGGQIRRVAVARALAAEPKMIFADESVAGLDVSVQAQLLNLLRGLCREMGLTLVFITHDLGVASYLCERIAVMYLGRIVEEGATADILRQPRHPYTRGLMRAFPSFGQPLVASLKGEIPSPIDLPRGCRFASRCPDARAECKDTDPPLLQTNDGRRVACLFPLTHAEPQMPAMADDQAGMPGVIVQARL